MFYSNFVEHDMKEVPVEDVILKEFVEMLNVVFPSHAPVTGKLGKLPLYYFDCKIFELELLYSTANKTHIFIFLMWYKI